MRGSFTFAVTAAALCVGPVAHAVVFTDSQLSYTNSFDNFRGMGFVSDPAAFAAASASMTDTAADYVNSNDIIARGLFDANEVTLDFGGSAFSDYAKGSSAGGSTSGGVIAFDVDSTSGINRALGAVLDTNNFTPGEFVFRFTNNASAAIESLQIGAALFYYNNNAGASTLSLYYSVGEAPVANGGTTGTSFLAGVTALPGASITSPTTADSTWALAKTVDETLQVTVPVGQTFYLYAFTSEVASGRDNLAIDDVSVTATLVPEPAGFAAVAAVLPLAIRRRRAR